MSKYEPLTLKRLARKAVVREILFEKIDTLKGRIPDTLIEEIKGGYWEDFVEILECKEIVPYPEIPISFHNFTDYDEPLLEESTEWEMGKYSTFLVYSEKFSVQFVMFMAPHINYNHICLSCLKDVCKKHLTIFKRKYHIHIIRGCKVNIDGAIGFIEQLYCHRCGETLVRLYGLTEEQASTRSLIYKEHYRNCVQESPCYGQLRRTRRPKRRRSRQDDQD